MSDENNWPDLAERMFWKTPELVESLILHLDDYSILCLAQAKLS